MKNDDKEMLAMKASDLYVGKIVLKLNQNLVGTAIQDKIEYELVFGETLEIDHDTLFTKYTITKMDITLYNLNPTAFLLEIKPYDKRK